MPHRGRALALRPVVRRHEAFGRARYRSGPRRPSDVPSKALGERLLPLDGEHPRLVHLSPAVVGPPDPGLLLRRVPHDRREHGRSHRVPHVRCADATGRGRARHVVLEPAVAVRDARVARARSARGLLLSHQHAVDRTRHPVSVGRAHGDERHVLRRRQGALRRRDHPSHRLQRRGKAHVEVARHRRRSTRPDGPLRSGRHALRAHAAGDGRSGPQVLRRTSCCPAATSRTRSGTPAASS